MSSRAIGRRRPHHSLYISWNCQRNRQTTNWTTPTHQYTSCRRQVEDDGLFLPTAPTGLFSLLTRRGYQAGSSTNKERAGSSGRLKCWTSLYATGSKQS